MIEGPDFGRGVPLAHGPSRFLRLRHRLDLRLFWCARRTIQPPPDQSFVPFLRDTMRSRQAMPSCAKSRLTDAARSLSSYPAQELFEFAPNEQPATAILCLSQTVL